MQLTPVERYALKFMESSEECWSAEQLRAAEAQIEEQKRAWELKRLAALNENDDERVVLNDSIGGIPSDPDGGLLTYSHQDAVNQVKKKPGKSRNKSILSQSVDTPSETVQVSATNHRKRRSRLQGIELMEGLSKTEAVFSAVDTSTIDDTDDRLRTPDQSKRKRTRRVSSKRDSVSHVPDDASPLSSNRKALSPRTRSRGSVNINLWTLDVKPLIPGTKGIPSPKSSCNKIKGSSPVPLGNDIFTNGDCELENSAPSKKVKRVLSTDLDAEPDLDVIS